MPAPKPLADAQKKIVMDLFTTCDGKQLTAADLKSIMEPLNKAGIQGLAARKAMKPVGIKEENLRFMMPAPPRDGKMPPPGRRMGLPPGKKEGV